MDVRANLTTNRIELEKVRPVAQKSEGIVDQRRAVRSAAEDKENPSKEKPEGDTVDAQLADDDSTDCGDSKDCERHILDVRV